jgi:hypothetical protein
MDNVVDVIIDLVPEFKEYKEFECGYLNDKVFKNGLLDIFGRFLKNRIESYPICDPVIQRIFKFLNEQFNESDSDHDVLDLLGIDIFENISPYEKGMEVARKLLEGKALDSFNETAKYY